MFNLFKSKGDHIPNKHIGETKKMGIMEDDYTIAERKKRDLDFLKGNSKEDTFRDSEGYEMPISKLNGQTEALLRQAREGIKQEIAGDKKMTEESPEENEETVEAIKNKIKEKKHTESYPTSIHKFFSNRGHFRGGEHDGERIGQKPGLYKDYRPNLNPGAPGNRKERNRESRRLAEKTKGEQPFEEPDFNDFLPELKDEK